MLDFSGTSSYCWDLRVITHMNSRPSCEIKSGEGFLGDNHVVVCSRIYQVIFRPSEVSLQGMATLMISYKFSSTILVYSLWKSNMVLFEESKQLVDMLLHALTFRMKNPSYNKDT